MLKALPHMSRWFRNTATAIRAGRGVRSTAALIGGAAAAGATGGASIPAVLLYTALDFIVTEALIFFGQLIGEKLSSNYVYGNIRNTLASGLLNKERPVGEFKNYAGVLAGTQHSGDRGHALLSSIRNVRAFGGQVRDFGYDYNAVSGILRDVRTTTPAPDFERLTGHISLASQMFGVSESQITPSYGALSRIQPNADTGSISEQFINFFAALSGDGTLITSQLNMVEALTAFSESYGYAGKFNVNAAEELAKAVGFLSNSEIIRVQTTDVAIQTITSLDDVLLSGAALDNPRANELLAISGISPAEAVRGITGNADLLPKMLSGMGKKLGFGKDSFDEDGMTDAAYRKLVPYLTESLGMSFDMIQPVAEALQAYYSGQSQAEIQRRFSKAQGQAATGADWGSSVSFPRYLSMIADQEIALSDIMRANLTERVTTADLFHTIISQSSNVVTLTAMFTSRVANMLGVPMPAITPPTRGSSRKVVGSVSTTATAQAVGAFRQGITHSHRVSDDYVRAVLGGAAELGVNPFELHALIGFETAWTWSTSIKNPDSSATGYIQFMESTARSLGFTTAELAEMTPAEQMKQVVRYFQNWGLKPGSGVGDMYTIIFAPAFRDSSLDATVYQKGTAAARLNPALDYDGDGSISKWEIFRKAEEALGITVNPALLEEEEDDSLQEGSVTIELEANFMDIHAVAQTFTRDLIHSIGASV